MQRYYRAAKLVRQVNTLLLQNLHARLYPAATAPVPIDASFQRVDELLDLTDEGLFDAQPGAMLDAFLMLQRHPELRGMTARTLRALWRSRHRVDAAFRRDPANRARFLQIFREPRGLTHELRRMNLYGILGQYLPAFGAIVGQMQHDLFHVYTVDEHILMVIRNLRRFTEAQHAHEYPLCSRLIADFERKEALYLAALFHDIAKGRGGDHSTLGARDARRFCLQHGLAAEDAELVAWLVTEHLTMSQTAQKQDITDPAVVDAFAAKVDSERRLIALYLLTVADIRGTSPKVWNAWKAKLLEDLFHATRAALTSGDERAHDPGQHREAATRSAPAAAPVRGSGQRRARAVAPARYAVLPAPYRGRDRLACAASVLARRRAGAGRQSAARARWRRPAGARLPARPEGALRAHLRILRPRRAVDPRREDPHDASRLCARHVRDARPGECQSRVSRNDPVHRIRADARTDIARSRSSRPAKAAFRGNCVISR